MKINKKSNYINILLTILILFINTSCCEPILCAIKEEFDSERPIKNEKLVAQDCVSSSKDIIEYLKYSNVFMIRGTSFSIKRYQDQQNTFQISLQSSPSILKFGGKAKIGLNSLNNLVFMNQWPEGAFYIGALILLEDDPKGIPVDPFLNLYIYEPALNIDTGTFTFLFQPQDDMREIFLKSNVKECLLLIYSQEQNF